VLKVRTAASLLIAILGACVIGIGPYISWTYASERRDLQRAREPVAKVRIGTVREPTIAFTVPDDWQWRSLVRRLGKPTFLLIVDGDPGADRRLSNPATNEGVVVQAIQDDKPLIITATGLRPLGYSSPNPSAAFKFEAAPGTVVRISVRSTSTPISDDAFLMVFPLWNPLEMWHWGDSLSMGQGMFEFFMKPALLFVGVAMIFVAVVVGLLPLRPSR
jgi:hypothetical protein